jgi:hypothetical protein
MPIHTVPLAGPGTLTIGTGPGITVSSQVRAFAVEVAEEVTRTDAKKVLSGEELPASESATYNYTAKATFLQDDTTGGIIDYSYDNAGDEKAFSFKPNDARAAKIEGTLRIVPLNFGGEVDDPSPESEVTFSVIGTPTFTPAT